MEVTSALVDVTYGDVSQEEANRLARAAWNPLPVPHVAGSTEPWVTNLVASLARSIGARSILETGGYLGDTSVQLAEALVHLGGGALTVCEIDLQRAAGIDHRLVAYTDQYEPEAVASVHVATLAIDVLDFLRTTRDTFDLAFVDDCHEEAHVRQEIALLYPRMRSGGLILLHDVVGMCPGNTEELGRIVEKWGGYVLKLPRLGPAGGLGIIQVR